MRSDKNPYDTSLRASFKDGANLKNKTFMNANIGAVKACNADMSEVKAQGIILSNAILTGTNMSNAELIAAKLENADLTNVNLCGANLSLASLAHANMIDVTLNDKTDLRNTIMTNTIIDYIHLDKLSVGQKKAVRINDPLLAQSPYIQNIELSLKFGFIYNAFNLDKQSTFAILDVDILRLIMMQMNNLDKPEPNKYFSFHDYSILKKIDINHKLGDINTVVSADDYWKDKSSYDAKLFTHKGTPNKIKDISKIIGSKESESDKMKMIKEIASSKPGKLSLYVDDKIVEQFCAAIIVETTSQFLQANKNNFIVAGNTSNEKNIVNNPGR